MLDKLFSDEKIFRIFTFCSIVILFFIVLRKNKKEKFSQLSDANLQAIKNLGDVAAQITSSTTPGELTLNKLLIKDGSTNVNVLDTIKSMQVTIASKANSSNVFTKSEVNSKLEGKLNTSGGTLTGPLHIKAGNDPLHLYNNSNSGQYKHNWFWISFYRDNTLKQRFGLDKDLVPWHNSIGRGWL